MRVDHAAKAGEGSFKHCFKQRKNATLDEAALPTLMLAHVSKGHIAQAPCYILDKDSLHKPLPTHCTSPFLHIAQVSKGQ